MHYDFIGDIHGYAGKLVTLFEKLGYKRNGKGFSHPDRKAFFLGDYINRGPEIPQTLEIVRSMIDRGDALGIMGNHEYYAVCFTPKKSGGYLRQHSIKNILNQQETFSQFRNDESSFSEYLEWFLTLPVYVETAEFRAVHACWDASSIGMLTSRLANGRITPSLLAESREKGNELCAAVQLALKGKEMKLPGTSLVADKDDAPLTKIRLRWWEDPVRQTYRSISVQPDSRLADTAIQSEDLPNRDYYPASERPVFFGHYGLTLHPALFRKNVCCLDFGVAKGHYLTAYRFDGEQELQPEKLVYC